jgi:hypothetical protein
MSFPLSIVEQIKSSGSSVGVVLDRVEQHLKDERPASLKRNAEIVSFRVGLTPRLGRRILRPFTRGSVSAVASKEHLVVTYRLTFGELVFFATLWSTALTLLLFAMFKGGPAWPLALGATFWIAIAIGVALAAWLSFRRTIRELVTQPENNTDRPGNICAPGKAQERGKT